MPDRAANLRSKQTGKRRTRGHVLTTLAILTMCGVARSAPTSAPTTAPTAAPLAVPATVPALADADATARLERLPIDLDLLLAIDGLAVQRLGAAGRSAEQFLRSIGAFTRTGEAWDALAKAMGQEPGDAVDALLGRHAIVALKTDSTGASQIAVRSTVRAEVREQMGRLFKPSPRGLVSGVPVMAMGNGLIEMAAAPTDAGQDPDCAEVILAPRGSEDIFTEMVGTLRGGEPDHAMDLAWASLRSMGRAPVALLIRGPKAAPGPEEFFALTARPGVDGWNANFIATRQMLDAGSGLLPGDLLDAVSADAAAMPLGVAHPEALARTMRADALLFMSGPMRPVVADNLESAREARARMPMSAAMSRFGFSDAIWSKVGGVGFVSVHADSPEPGTDSRSAPIAMSVAFPVADVEAFAPLADAWGLSFAEGTSVQGQDPASPPPSVEEGVSIDAVRALEIHGASHLSGLVGPRGAVAWTFAVAAGQESSSSPRRGWWIVCVRTGEANAQHVVDRVRAMARDAASPGATPGDVVFRFMSRPALMRRITGARQAVEPSLSDGPSPASALARRVRDDTSGALDWLDRVETVIRQRPTFSELYDGTISIQMRTDPSP